jgi:hypothetical protein
VADPAHRLFTWFTFWDTEYLVQYRGGGRYIVEREALDETDRSFDRAVGRLEGMFGFSAMFPWFFALFWTFAWMVKVPATQTLPAVVSAFATLLAGLAVLASLGDIGNVTVDVIDEERPAKVDNTEGES